MSIIMKCPYLITTDGISKLCMNGRFPCDCKRCSCLDKQYVEITTTTTFGTSAWPNYLKRETTTSGTSTWPNYLKGE